MNSNPSDSMPIRGAACLRLDMEGCEPTIVELETGRNVIGRAEGQNIQVDHPTVSEAHCEIEIAPQGARVRDLGSTDGTFINGLPVQEAALHPGQILQLGEVRFIFQASHPVTLPEAAVEPTAPPPDFLPEVIARGCAHHLSSHASWACTECARHLCSACVKTVRLAPDRVVTICQTCHGVCERLGAGATVTQGPRTFMSGVLNAFYFPLKGSGLLVLVGVSVLNLLASLLGGFRIFGALAIILGIAVGAWLLMYLRQTLLKAAEGSEENSLGPDMEAQASTQVVLQFAAVYLVSFGSWTLYSLWMRPETDAMIWVGHALLALGAVYFPMALLAVFLYDDAAALNPLLILPSIVRVPGRYSMVCLVFAALIGLTYLTEESLTELRLPLISAVVSGFLSSYSALVMARVIGWFYFCARDQLAWR